MWPEQCTRRHAGSRQYACEQQQENVIPEQSEHDGGELRRFASPPFRPDEGDEHVTGYERQKETTQQSSTPQYRKWRLVHLHTDTLSDLL